MFKTVGFAFAVCAIGTLTIAWSQTKGPLQPGPLPVSKFNDMSFVFTEN